MTDHQTAEGLLDGLEEELGDFGADDLIVFGVRYEDDEELEIAIWDSVGDPALIADILEDYLISYRKEHGLNEPSPKGPPPRGSATNRGIKKDSAPHRNKGPQEEES